MNLKMSFASLASLSPRERRVGREVQREERTSSPRPSPPVGEEREKTKPTRTRFMVTICSEEISGIMSTIAGIRRLLYVCLIQTQNEIAS